MTERGKLLLGAMRRNLELLREHERASPAEVDQIVTMLVAHIRNWKPTSLTTMDTAPFMKVDP